MKVAKITSVTALSPQNKWKCLFSVWILPNLLICIGLGLLVSSCNSYVLDQDEILSICRDFQKRHKVHFTKWNILCTRIWDHGFDAAIATGQYEAAIQYETSLVYRYGDEL